MYTIYVGIHCVYLKNKYCVLQQNFKVLMFKFKEVLSLILCVVREETYVKIKIMQY